MRHRFETGGRILALLAIGLLSCEVTAQETSGKRVRRGRKSAHVEPTTLAFFRRH